MRRAPTHACLRRRVTAACATAACPAAACAAQVAQGSRQRPEQHQSHEPWREGGAPWRSRRPNQLARSARHRRFVPWRGHRRPRMTPVSVNIRAFGAVEVHVMRVSVRALFGRRRIASHGEREVRHGGRRRPNQLARSASFRRFVPWRVHRRPWMTPRAPDSSRCASARRSSSVFARAIWCYFKCGGARIESGFSSERRGARMKRGKTRI